MKAIEKRILIAGIKIKMSRGEKLEDILASYVKLADEEKQEIRDALEE